MKGSLIFFILLSIMYSQEKYPADSILKSPNISFFSKVALLPIAGWQRISYNTNLFNCQFYPSCSNYGTDAIKKYGIIKGGAVASERITRCNPKAYHYQLQQKRPFNGEDGRLIDPVNISTINPSKKSPYLAALISVIIPGSGRFYAGRKFDGISGLWSFIIYSYTAYGTKNNKNKITTSIFTSLCFYVYLGEIYGGWRTAKYYQPFEKID
jgi:putative component of membrane protein insertase Oxa1/YidC/SpoIIIJ protein YidD/TM2 domain-containing membrane protein YozV